MLKSGSVQVTDLIINASDVGLLYHAQKSQFQRCMQMNALIFCAIIRLSGYLLKGCRWKLASG